jgi:GT2 family glycosyltransferase
VPPHPTATVVIATLRRPDVVSTCLDAILAHDHRPLEVLVVDGDPERSAEPVAHARAAGAVPVRYLSSPPGLTRQRNAGLDAATGDVVVFIDDDARPRPGALARLLSEYGDPTVVGATGRVLEPASNRRLGKESRLRQLLPGAEGTMTRFGYPRRLVHADVSRDVEFMAGCFMSARTALAREVRFDERLSGYGLAEDEDFGYRLSRRGRVRYVADAEVDHDNSGFGTRDRQGFGRTVVVNRAYLFQKSFRTTPLAKAQFCLLVAALAGHRLANRDLLGARGVVAGAREARESWRTGRWQV